MSLLLNALALAACILLFGAKGTIVAACLASLALIVRSVGLKYSRRRYFPFAKQGMSRFGRLIMIHSHHNLDSQIIHHEFCIGGKYFCAGCYGLALGTLLALILPAAFLFHAVSGRVLAILPAFAPLCFLPAILRRLIPKEVGALFRFVSYGLLPVGSWIAIIHIHTLWHNWLPNVLVLGLVVLGWNAGGFK